MGKRKDGKSKVYYSRRKSRKHKKSYYLTNTKNTFRTSATESMPIHNTSEEEIEVERQRTSPDTITDYVIEGRRIVDIQKLFKEIQNLSRHPPFNCTIADMNILTENRKGLKSSILLKCKMCNLEKYLNLFTQDESETSMDINAAAALATISTGIGFTAAEEFMAILDVPFMSPNTYQQHHEFVGEKIRETAWKAMEEAAQEESLLAKELGEVDQYNRPCITVVADGAWSKRSYNVNYDAASGVRTGKLLFLGIRNKYCSFCAYASAKNMEVIPDHTCYKNWSNTSTSMESDIIVEGFRKSIDMYNIIYKRLVGDGDSSVYKKLIEARPYGSLHVEKIECRNHLLRNFCSKLREISSKKRSNSTNNPVSPYLRKHILNNIRRMRTAVAMAVTQRNKEDKSFSIKIENLTKDLKNIPSHVFGEHLNCTAIGYFRCEKKFGEKNYIEEMKACGVLQDIEVCLNRLILHASSLLRNMDNNVAEHYNSVVCKFIGGKRINFSKRGSYQIRCEAAALSYNLGSGEYHRQIFKSIAEKSPSGHTKKFINRVKQRRINTLKIRPKTLFKKRNKLIALPDKDYGNQEADNSIQPDMEENLFEEKKKEFLEELEKNENEIKDLEISTRGQGGNPKWYQERSLRLTASNFGNICKMLEKTNCKNKVKAILYSKFRGNKHTKYGTEKEPFAIQQFEETYNLKVEMCGLFIDSECCALAASPDGLVGSRGLVEVKCPSTASAISPTEAINKKIIKFATLDENGQMHLKQNHDYFYQIQGQLHITKRDFCYFILWTPMGMLVEQIWRQDSFWNDKMIGKLKSFYYNCLLPEIIDPRYSRGLEIRNPSRK
ncbi:uncharacterized protein LOC126743213 isoform X2 [Anthonomus grandis grandis]|uniref:uncharacterized protein LOC126743213 isoform X2 n=1 Tax=Anthonomus grandis grandis TaxID=2921223 RepID=UPI002166305B|nr:uncharacterized protein LOC126743213 isoform X2 [Anthonomus grandis grandis]